MGCQEDKLKYCKKFYPQTTSWEQIEDEKNAFCRAGATKCTDVSTKDVYACIGSTATAEEEEEEEEEEGEEVIFVPPTDTWATTLEKCMEIAGTDKSKNNKCESDALTATTATTATGPKISYWCGKVNLHFDVDSQMWKSDPNKSDGCDIDQLKYCKKFYPQTTSVEKLEVDEKNRFCKHGATRCTEVSTKPVYACIGSTAKYIEDDIKAAATANKEKSIAKQAEEIMSKCDSTDTANYQACKDTANTDMETIMQDIMGSDFDFSGFNLEDEVKKGKSMEASDGYSECLKQANENSLKLKGKSMNDAFDKCFEDAETAGYDVGAEADEMEKEEKDMTEDQ